MTAQQKYKQWLDGCKKQGINPPNFVKAWTLLMFEDQADGYDLTKYEQPASFENVSPVIKLMNAVARG